MTSPADLANRALDAAGADFTIGDIEEGGKVAEIIRRVYVPARQQLLRTARWPFARRQADLALLADRFSQTPDLPNQVIWPWRFEYQYPIDCLQIRFVPADECRPVEISAPPNATPGGNFVNVNVGANYVLPGVNTIGSRTQHHTQLRQGRFLVAVDPNYPGLVGAITDNSQNPSFGSVQGVGPTGRTVILTNVRRAQAVYTMDVEYPDEWDVSFQEAFVAYLTNLIALPVAIALDKDKKFGLEMEARAMAKAKGLIGQARVAAANEGQTTTDSTPDWIHGRFRGGIPFGAGGFGDGFGFSGSGSGGIYSEECGPTVFGNGSTW
jgi:hypothetical protein